MEVRQQIRYQAETAPECSQEGERRLHRSTLSIGDQTQTTYSTTHTESFTGRSCESHPLEFKMANPCYPSQPYSSADLLTIPARSSYTSTQSRDVHSPKDMIPPSVLHSLRSKNWTQNREGLSMKEIINPPESTVYISSYHTQHCSHANSPASSPQTSTSGRPTHWHRYNILTGKDKDPAGSKTLRRLSGDRML